MKFKNTQHQALYNEAITQILAQKYADAFGTFETLKVLLGETRGNQANIAAITKLVQTLKTDPEQLHNELKNKPLKERIEALEKTANDLYTSNQYHDAIKIYDQIIIASSNNDYFAYNHADAYWSQGACYESIAASLKATDLKKAIEFIEKAMNSVKKSLVLYLALNAREDIDVCIQKLNSLKEHKSLLSEDKMAECQLFLIGQLRMSACASRTNTTTSLDVLANAAEMLSSPMSALWGFKKFILEKHKVEKSNAVSTHDKARDHKPM